MHKINCPNCQSNLTEADASGVQTFTCRSCSGIWVSGKALDILFRMEGTDINILKLKSLSEQGSRLQDRKCPTCEDSLLSVVIIDSIEIDICSSCAGAYFDHTELEKVVPKTHISQQSGVGAAIATELTFWGVITAITGLG